MTRTPIAALLLALATGGLGTGCIATVPYEPNQAISDDLGVYEAQRRLEETLARAIEPPIIAPEVTESSFGYTFKEIIRGAYYIPMGSVENYNRIYFANVGRLELYENHYVYVYGHDDRLINKVLFGSAEDATLFIDLVWSLRNRRPSTPGGR